MGVELLPEHHLEFLSLKGGCTGTSESTLVKMPHCWKSRVAAQLLRVNESDHQICQDWHVYRHLCCWYLLGGTISVVDASI